MLEYHKWCGTGIYQYGCKENHHFNLTSNIQNKCINPQVLIFGPDHISCAAGGAKCFTYSPETANLPLKFYNVSKKLDSFFWNLTPESSNINNHKNRHFRWGPQKCVCIGIAKPRDFHTKSGLAGFSQYRWVHFEENIIHLMHAGESDNFLISSTQTWIRMRGIFQHPAEVPPTGKSIQCHLAQASEMSFSTWKCPVSLGPFKLERRQPAHVR